MSDAQDNKIYVTKEQMRAFARYEITLCDIIDSADFEGGDIIFSETCSFTLDDLYHALLNIREQNPTAHDLGEYWYYPIDALSMSVDPDREQESNGAEHGEFSPYSLLITSDYCMFNDIWFSIGYMLEDCDDDYHVAESAELDSLIVSMEQHFENRDKPIEERTFTVCEKENYIRYFDDDNNVKKASEDQLALCREFVDELCEEGNELALHIKGYSCYGGNRLYDCDWHVSRDCMTRLFEKTDNPQYANTLGYIYYYGRCSGGTPEYDKAFHCFEISAANGLYEGMYKLADMFLHGYGCKQSKNTATRLYEMVYEDSRKNFLKGEHASFADIALRMGNIYAKETSRERNPEIALFYYLQAEYAANLRAQEDDFFGNTTVVINTQKAIEGIIEQFSEDYFREYVDYITPWLIQELSENNNRCTLIRKKDSEGNWQVTAARMPTKSVENPDYYLLVVPELRYCVRTHEITVTLIDTTHMWFKDDADKVRYDFVGYSDTEGRYDFYYDDELTAYIKAKRYRISAPVPVPPHGSLYHMVSVKFGGNGRSYDYICDFMDVQPGDTVIVESYDGETEVTVTKVYTKHESELGLPVTRYKKIIRKA